MSDDEYEIPLQDKRVFGAGIKRQKVHFVPALSFIATAAEPQSKSGLSAADRYLNLVLPQNQNAHPTADTSSTLVCDICSLPLASTSETRPHASSLAHQVCLTHSHPPSSLDRRRKGLQLLQSQGWDPDSRRGLGAEGDGIQYPVKVAKKDDKLGLGVVLPSAAEREKWKRQKVVKLDAGRVRKLEAKEKERKKALQDMFYRDERLEGVLKGVGREWE